MNNKGILTTMEELYERDYDLYDVPDDEGILKLTLKFRAWHKGRGMGLICYFIDEEGFGYRLYAWRHSVDGVEIYNPKKCKINFAEVEDGTVWNCTMTKNKKGNLEWTDAVMGEQEQQEKRPEVTYTQCGDYFIPNLTVDKVTGTLGKYSFLRESFLKEHYKGIYEGMLLQQTLWNHLAEIEEQAQNRLDKIVEQMQNTEGVTEELKANDQMEWVAKMNGIKNRAEEIVLKEIVYCM